MTAYELAKKYYPRLWDKTRIDKLLEAEKISQEEYQKIISEND